MIKSAGNMTHSHFPADLFSPPEQIPHQSVNIPEAVRNLNLRF